MKVINWNDDDEVNDVDHVAEYGYPRHGIKSTIKGARLTEMPLDTILRYNATDMFIETLNNMINVEEYPIVNGLLKKAAIYNNTTVFKFLLNNTDMSIDEYNIPMSICTNGNIDILESYLAATDYHPLPNKTITQLPKAIDKGNIQFIHLWLKHTPFQREARERSEENVKIKFKNGRGITLGMLRMLHEEFQCLFMFTDVWPAILLHSVKHNLPECVQYMIDNLPDGCRLKQSSEAYDPNVLLMDMGAKCLEEGHFSDYEITMALDRGRENFLNHLLQYHLDDGTLRNEEKLLSCFMSEGKGRLRVTPSAAILHDDFVSMEIFAQERVEINLNNKQCRKMSLSMVRCIANMHSPPLVLSSRTLKEMMLVPHLFTSDIMCQILNNVDIPTNIATIRSMQCLMKVAAGHSMDIAHILHTRFGLDYNLECVTEALTNLRDQKTFESILQHVYLYTNRIKEAVHTYIEQQQSLSAVVFVIDQMNIVRNDPVTCKHATINPNIAVFEHVFKLFTLDQLDKDGHINAIFNEAMNGDRMDIVNMIQQRCIFERGKGVVLDASPMRLKQLTLKNCFKSLAYLFNHPPFIDMPKMDQLRMIHIVKDLGYQNLKQRVVTICLDQITLISKRYSRRTTQRPNNLSELNHVIHSVFSDAKLGKLIMEHIGHIHRSWGLKEYQLIKGAKLLDYHCLDYYLYFGATEWFLKGYNDTFLPTIGNNNQHHHNSDLLEMALSFCNKRVAEVLLANPKMSFRVVDERNPISAFFVAQLSKCAHPDWEWALDQYFKLLGLPSKTEIDRDTMQYIRHPSFLRKLKYHGIGLMKFNQGDANMVTLMWLEEPYALEMLELLKELSLLTDVNLQSTLLVAAVSLGLTSIVRYLIDTYENYMDISDAMDACCQYGRLEYLEWLLPCSLNKRPSGKQSFGIAVEHGQLAMAQRMSTVITSTGDRHLNRLSKITKVLEDGNLQMVNFLLDISADMPKNKDSKTTVNNINPKILTIDLLERLMANPNIKCNFAQVMGQAIKFCIERCI
ncbi:hypothetical protein SAMD00019534_056900 [Acytostelium subglobosum LB1]|uniref:hypothetical protein n=1 Tax=Acytostelium subglobosum LB1 TaxID=1410327 RepID=UPI000645159B|nr:hypothetical protein SAMD00019534_056900 [Acytostelium subglobosum LB1]GAM22515.1 hypothetical protein SAMD00019534_056900 [Acytostelium subglobosum LB1]|eukprot:XP_012754635.1 hypothetical protein SAMD00019534_056900 [Acytostelium subglobosum LB1]